MGSLSFSTQRGRVQWKKLLMVVSLLTFWSPPTTAKISIASTFAAEGKDVILHVRNQPPEALGFVWYKGNDVDNKNIIGVFMLTPSFLSSGPENYERAIVLTDGSLLLKKVTMKDTGPYTLVVHLPDSETDIGSALLHVVEHLRVPVLIPSSYWVIENDDDVVLTCYTNGLSIQWLLNDMNLKFTGRMKLTADGRRLTIDPVKREDAGVYKCMATNPVMRVESQPIELHVYYK